eukprot:TRINITY_DN5417_c0_g2_i1.p1 TRINITY_DN5417_c0_g2~~TRINITY_DN5417_c0_g2_i1.p1  ORF type:complete len:194 (-),score=61.68 TRINITY_DN5417_c0_g2_i1:130-651(-)
MCIRDRFKVMSKLKWLQYKEDFKKIKQELLNQMKQDESETKSRYQGTEHGRDEFIPKEFELEPGCLVQLDGLSPASTRESIKAAVSHYYEPDYVDYKKSGTSAIVRFSNSTIAQGFIDKYTDIKELVIDGEKITLSKIKGETEEKYWAKIQEEKNKFRKHHYELKKKRKMSRD